MNEYQDILNEKRYVSPNRAGMTPEDRAAQFSAFAALTGFDGVIRETGRLTDRAADLDECEKLAINEALCAIVQQLDTQPAVSLTWFRPDSRKTGGAYVRYTGKLKKIDTFYGKLCFADGTQIPIDSLRHIQRDDP